MITGNREWCYLHSLEVVYVYNSLRLYSIRGNMCCACIYIVVMNNSLVNSNCRKCIFRPMRDQFLVCTCFLIVNESELMLSLCAHSAHE